MRYHSSLPLRAKYLNRPADLTASQRSQPTTCVLSLASVTASMSSTEKFPTHVGEMDMDIGPTMLKSVSLPSENKTSVVPFPTSKRTHSLLRSTPYCPRQPQDTTTTCSTNDDPGESSASSDPDLNPPRKRTRISALSTSSSRTRSERSSSLLHKTVSSSSRSMSGSPLAQIPSLATPSTTLMTQPPSPPTVGDSLITSSPWPRRRSSPSELRVLLYLYRTLVYGLETKYPKMLMKYQSDAAAPSSLSDCECQSDRSYLDIHDAILAQHLRAHLLGNGTSTHLLVVDPASIAREGQEVASLAAPVESTAMNVDSVDDFSAAVAPAIISHLHLLPSTNHSVLSYQQLTATLIMRQSLHSRRSPTKLSSRRSVASRPRWSSKLSQSISLD